MMFRHEIGGGTVSGEGRIRLGLPIGSKGYMDAQLDDYGRLPSVRHPRRQYPWQAGVNLSLRARFSHSAGQLVGTAGFGFWNAPFGDPNAGWPALPQATWFFYGSPPTDLPLANTGKGQGWFASTLDATRWRAIRLAPLAPMVLLLNRLPRFRQYVWPRIQAQLGISFQTVPASMTEWHQYELSWQPSGCRFWVDGKLLLETPHGPQGPLGFVCWLDNQAMVCTPNGRFWWGLLPIKEPQWLEISDLRLESRRG